MKKKVFYSLLFLVSISVVFFTCGDDPPLPEPDDTCPFIVESNGVDDTQNLRDAFAKAIAAGPDCEVQLAEGVYYTEALFIENFKGIFKGAGKDKTFIRLLPGLDFGAFKLGVPPTATSPWPVVITFSGGDIMLSDMSFQVPETKPVTYTGNDQEWYVLFGIVWIAGEMVNSKVENVGFEGLEVSDEDGGTLGSNVLNALIIGSFIGTPWAVGGIHEVYSCSFNKVATAFVIASVDDTDITLGGSTEHGNTFNNVYYGCEINNFSNSVIEISYNNVIDTRSTSMRVVQEPGQLSSTASEISFKDNIIESGEDAVGIFLNDIGLKNGENKSMDANVTNNKIHVTGHTIGIFSPWLKDGEFNKNEIHGSAACGIFVKYSTACDIVNNYFENLEAIEADIVLGEETSNNKVVCGPFNTTVVDKGTDNEVDCN